MATTNYPLSIFVYPISPLPNTTYQHSDVNFPFALAIDNIAAARDYGFTLSFKLTTPDGSSDILSTAEYGPDDEPELLENGTVGVYSGKRSLPPGLYSLTWEFSWATCYTYIYDERRSRGKFGGKSTKTKEGVNRDDMAVTGSIDFMLDLGGGNNNNNNNNSTRILSEDDFLNNPNNTTYGPGTLIAEVLGTHDKAEVEDCPVINPDDRSNSTTTTRSAEPTRTIPNDDVPARATVTEVRVTSTSSPSSGSATLTGLTKSHLFPVVLLCVWPLVMGVLLS